MSYAYWSRTDGRTAGQTLRNDDECCQFIVEQKCVKRCGRCVSALPHLVLFAKNNRKKYFFSLSNRTEIQWNILLRSIVYLLSSVIGGGVGVIGFLAWQTGGPGLSVWGGSFFCSFGCFFLSFFGFKWKENICPDVGLDGSTYPVSCHSKPPPLSLMYVKGWNV